MNLETPTSVADADVTYHLHSQTNPQAHLNHGPYIASEGDGAYIIDETGKRYVDAMAGLWSASLGFNNARLGRAAADQYAKLGFYHSFYGRTSQPTTNLAEKLVKLTKFDGGKTFFATSGSEANETMVKLAWLYHASRGKATKRKIIARDRAFHGSTIVAGSMCGLEGMHREFGLPLPGFLHTLAPNTYRGKLTGETDVEFVRRLAEEFEKLILREGPDTIAAFIAEPVNAGGGIIVPPEGYFAAMQSILAKYDILCLDDEVVCGFGRTGNWFGFQSVGMKPDMMSLAKGLTASYFPMSAVVLSSKIFEAIERVNHNGGLLGHGFTNSGHPVGAAIALEAIAIYEELDIPSHVRKMEEILVPRLHDICRGSKIVGNIRGIGLMHAVELVENQKTGAPFDPALQVGLHFQEAAYERGLIIRPMRDIVGMCPPLIIDENVLEDILTKFKSTLQHIEEKFGRN